MFKFTDNNEREVELKAQRMLGEILTQMALESDAPESDKRSVRVVKAAIELGDCADDIFIALRSDPKKLNIDNAKKMCLFLIAVKEQVKAFIEQNPLVTEVSDEEDI